MEYYIVIKINELWLHSSAWMNFNVFQQKKVMEANTWYDCIYIKFKKNGKIMQCKTINTNKGITNRKLRIGVPLGKRVNVIQGATVGMKGMSNFYS